MVPAEWLQYAPKPRELSDGEKWNVFLSYRSVNRTWVLNLYDILIELGYKVFIDQCVLGPGDNLIIRLQDALRTSQAGVLIWSKEAEESDWVQKEYATLETKATRSDKFRFVPVKLDAQELPDFAANRVHIDFSSYPDGPNGGELIRLLHGIVGVPMDRATVKFADKQNEIANAAILEINTAVKQGDVDEILELSKSEILPWRTAPSLGCKAAESLIKLKHYPEAIEILTKLQEQFSKAIRPKQLHALALARTELPENLKKAQRILGKLYEQGERDPETLGIYARTWMDRFITSQDERDLEQSVKYYAEAFDKAPDDYYTGINAASKSVLLGTDDSLMMAGKYADQVLKLVGTSPVPNDYWKTATVAELFLIKKDYRNAGAMYAEAVKMEPNSRGSHQSSKNQAAKLLKKLHADDAQTTEVLKAFKHLENEN